MKSPEAPTATYVEDSYRFTWPAALATMHLERFFESSDDIRCELTVVSTDPVNGGEYYSGRLLLIGPNSLRDIAKHLTEYDPDLDWTSMLGQVRKMARERYRSGAPLVDLRDVDTTQVNKYLVYPLMYDNAISQIYGHGETAKSATALILALAIASGQDVFGFEAEVSGPVIYADFEDDEETHAERLQALCRGAHVDLHDAPIYYKRVSTSLKEAARDLRRQVSELGAVAVIVDSVGMACGGDPNEAGAIIAALTACRSLGVPVLVIHHLPKDAKDKTKPYGSVYASNEVRLSWHVEGSIQRDPNGDTHIRNVYTCHKANRGAPADSLRLAIDLRNVEGRLDTIDVTRLGFRDTLDINAGSQKWQIVSYLKRTGKATVKDIAVELDIKPPRIRRIIGEHPDLFVRLSEEREPLWGISVDSEMERSRDRDPLRSPDRGDPIPPGGYNPGIAPGSRQAEMQEEEDQMQEEEDQWAVQGGR